MGCIPYHTDERQEPGAEFPDLYVSGSALSWEREAMKCSALDRVSQGLLEEKDFITHGRRKGPCDSAWTLLYESIEESPLPQLVST